jgi:hypothetical protein
LEEPEPKRIIPIEKCSGIITCRGSSNKDLVFKVCEDYDYHLTFGSYKEREHAITTLETIYNNIFKEKAHLKVY